MAILHMTIGLPGSGKSTFYKEKLSLCEYISSDAIRAEVFGSEEDQTHNSEVFQIMFKRTVEALKAGKDVYYDATNLSSKRRIAFIKEVGKAARGTVFKAIVFAIPYEVCLMRNDARERVVPHDVISKMRESFEVPHESEGFSKIHVIRDEPTGLSDVVDELMDMPHDNPHHQLSVGCHMRCAADVAKSKDVPPSVYEAVRFHDVGKKYTKRFFDARGRVSTVAHFYNHEKVGAYEYLSKIDDGREDAFHLYVALLIQHHMDFFKGEAYLKKIHDRFGDDFYSDLEMIHFCDVAAH